MGGEGFLPLLVPVEGHAVVCQVCAALVLDNPNALGAHRDSHRLADAAIAADDLPARVEALAKEWEDAAKRFEERLYRDDAEALRGHAADLRNLLDDPTTGRRS